MEITLERAEVEVLDRYGHLGEAGAVVVEALELRNVGTGVDAFKVVRVTADGREYDQVPPTTSGDAYAAFDLIRASRVPDDLRGGLG